jgi:hypothetical protein
MLRIARIVLIPADFVGSGEAKSVLRHLLLQFGGARSGPEAVFR